MVAVDSLFHLLLNAQIIQPIQCIADLFCPFIVAKFGCALHLCMHFISKPVDTALTFKDVLQCYYIQHILLPHYISYAWRIAILDEVLQAGCLGQPITYSYLE